MQTRIGVIYPGDGALDQELWQFAPASVSLHLTRTRLASAPITKSMIETMVAQSDIEICAEALSPIKPAVVTYACTSGSFIKGRMGEEQLLKRIHAASGSLASTTSTAIVAACRALGLTNVSVAAPYVPEVTRCLGTFLVEHGLEVCSISQLGLEGDIVDVDETTVMKLAHEVDHPDAQGIVISCTNLRTLGAIPMLEEALGKPVISANQATIWHACELAGVSWDLHEGVGELCVGASPVSA